MLAKFSQHKDLKQKMLKDFPLEATALYPPPKKPGTSEVFMFFAGVVKASSCLCAVSFRVLELPKIRGTLLLGVPIIRITVIWVYISSPLFWETTML